MSPSKNIHFAHEVPLAHSPMEGLQDIWPKSADRKLINATRAPRRDAAAALTTGMATADNQNVVHWSALAVADSGECVFHVKHHFPKQNRPNKWSKRSSTPARPVS
jgi:hypothetical protein